MPSRLDTMNSALRILGQTLLVSPDAALESARQLNGAWNSAVGAAYEITNWTFTLKRIMLPRSADVPAFGYDYYYDLPGDWARTAYISATGIPDDHLRDYATESGKIATNADQVYFRYVSRDLMSLTPGSWSQSFADYVSAQLAIRTAPKLNPSALEAASQFEQKYRVQAVSGDAVKNPPARRLRGSLARAVTLGSRINTEQG